MTPVGPQCRDAGSPKERPMHVPAYAGSLLRFHQIVTNPQSFVWSRDWQRVTGVTGLPCNQIGSCAILVQDKLMLTC